MSENTRRINNNFVNDPFFIGFDNVFNKLSHFHNHKNTTNYPPYNLIKTDDNSYVIEMAVAGFSEEDIDIELHDGILTISSDVEQNTIGVQYLNRGIATRSFERKFTLADTIEVTGAHMQNGLLIIELKNVIPEEKKPKKIDIGVREERDRSFLRD